MTMGVFSNFQQNAMQGTKTAISPVNYAQQVPQEKTTKQKVKEILPYALPLVSIPVAVLISNKMSAKSLQSSMKNVMGHIDLTTKDLKTTIEKSTSNQIGEIQGKLINGEVIEGLKNDIKKLAGDVAKSKKSSNHLMAAVIAAAGLSGAGYQVGKLSDEKSKEVGDKLAQRMNDAVDRSERAMASSGQALSSKYFHNDNGINLLINTDSLNKHNQKYATAIQTIRDSAAKYLYEKPTVQPLKPGDTVWSITSEFAPVKEGGLGSVPVEVQSNMERLGINTPTFVPMYQDAGISFFKEENGKYTYQFKGEKNKFDLTKVASFQVTAYQGNKPSVETVEFFSTTVTDKEKNKHPLIFVKNDKYFNGTIYQTSEKSEEPEKFAFFSKAMYEFMKAKNEDGTVKNLVIHDKEAYDSIKAPDALILNDWQASPVAALARYKAPMENAYKKLSDNVSNKIANINIITIGHNTMYQGSTSMNNSADQRKQATSNILNTLFDGYTNDIVQNAKTKSRSRNEDDAGLENLSNVLILNKQDPNYNHTNLLGMGVCLSNYFNPVSKNYAKEIIADEHQDLSGELRWFLTQRTQSNSMVGIINGNDFDNISIKGKQKAILESTGVEFEMYDKKSNIDDIMKAREKNKINFYENYVIPFSMKNDIHNNSAVINNIRELSNRLELVDPTNAGFVEMTAEELKDTPVIASVGRFVSQKGIDVMTGAVKKLLDNWETDFPGKNKPIFYLAGEDPENGAQRKYVEDLKSSGLSPEDNKRVLFAHGFAPMPAITAASDFFLLPSHFEPCGLTQGESFALATPVIASAVGGIVDTVNREGKTNGILTTHKGNLTVDAFYDAMKKGLKIYFDDKEQYKKMVKDSLAEDFSWIQPGKQGPVFDYVEELGFNKADLKDIKKA